MSYDHDYICALSGAPAKVDELVEDGPEDNPLEELPVGWVQVTVIRRELNPAWMEIQAVKGQTLQGALSQVPEEQRPLQERYLAIQIEANFSALEARIPKYIEDTQTAYVADPHGNTEVRQALNEVMEALDLEEFIFEEEEGESAPAEEAPAEEAAPEAAMEDPAEPPEPPEPEG